MNIIKQTLPVTELLAGLAEEASELAQAALKLRRIFDGTNPTPVPKESGLMHLREEIADVLLYITMLDDVSTNEIAQIMLKKQLRWEQRITARRNADEHV